jgi:hypothetical protein
MCVYGKFVVFEGTYMNFIDLISTLRDAEKQILLNITYPGVTGEDLSLRERLLSLDSVATLQEMINAFIEATLRRARLDLNIL